MRGKVKYVERQILNEYDMDSDSAYPVRNTYTRAVLYDDTCVYIDEDEVREHYGRTRITEGLIKEMSQSLHNTRINYEPDDEDVNYLDGDLEDYL